MRNHILVIDDDKEILELFNTILIESGYTVTLLTEIDDIKATIAAYKPDLVIIDYLLQGINGGELCSQIKRDIAITHIPVILTSAHARVLLSLGTYNCDEFLEKPFDVNHLIERVTYLLKNVKQALT